MLPDVWGIAKTGKIWDFDLKFRPLNGEGATFLMNIVKQVEYGTISKSTAKEDLKRVTALTDEQINTILNNTSTK